MKTKFEEGKKYLGEDGHKYLVKAVGRGTTLLAVRVIDLTANVEMTLEDREYDPNISGQTEFTSEAVHDENFERAVYAIREIEEAAEEKAAEEEIAEYEEAAEENNYNFENGVDAVEFYRRRQIARALWKAGQKFSNNLNPF